MNRVEYYPTATVSSFTWSQKRKYLIFWYEEVLLTSFIVFWSMVILIIKIKQSWVLSFVMGNTINVIQHLYIVTAQGLEVIVSKAVARLGPFDLHGITLIPAWISDYMRFQGWDEITYPIPNFNGCTIEVWEWIIIFIPHLNIHVISFPCW